MSAALDKAQKLIALSASPNTEEARTAAYQACKLIREHNLTISVKPTITLPNIKTATSAAVHLTANDRTALCLTPLTHGVNYFHVAAFPKGVPKAVLCMNCLRKIFHPNA